MYMEKTYILKQWASFQWTGHGRGGFHGRAENIHSWQEDGEGEGPGALILCGQECGWCNFLEGNAAISFTLYNVYIFWPINHSSMKLSYRILKQVPRRLHVQRHSSQHCLKIQKTN